jgi:SPP1 gp7 family putative phage head morphogenesis protein
MPEIELKPLPFEEAIEAFKGLVPLTPDEFYALAEEARALAFTVSRVMRMDVLVDMHGAADAAISEGETLADFRNRLDDIFEARGWAAPPEMTPWRLETIFRTNVQTAYTTGRYKQMIDQVEAFPYWEYDAVNDARTRPTHAALDGKIFPADHPFWDIWYPPNGYNCRCGVNPVHRSEEVTVETEDPTNGLIEPIDPATGNRMPARPLIPDPGWGHNPAKERWHPDLEKYPPELRAHFEEERS